MSIMNVRCLSVLGHKSNFLTCAYIFPDLADRALPQVEGLCLRLPLGYEPFEDAMQNDRLGQGETVRQR